jgi:predicted alpha/beta-fold hydrolase
MASVPAVALLAMPLLLAGCFQERAAPMRAGDRVLLARGEFADVADSRAWLRRAHRRLQHLLPTTGRAALLTEELADANGRPIDVYATFGIDAPRLTTLLWNGAGLLHSAQAAGTAAAPEGLAAPWPGFEDVWIPVAAGVRLSGRLGLAREGGQVRSADCIVIVPGVLGDNNVHRSRDIAGALLAAGLHVLSLELRGAGRTWHEQPAVASTFGALEASDLLAVSEWLEARPDVRRTGLVGHCWGANLALLAAWESGRFVPDPDVSAELERRLPVRDRTRTHFEAGILAFSPILPFEQVMADLDRREWPLLENPVYRSLQAEIDARAALRGYTPLRGSLGRLIALELRHSPLDYDGIWTDGLRYLRLVPHERRPVGAKLAAARQPVLLVHAVNDPMMNAQAVADVIAGVSNRNVAALMLPGGGHVGFAQYAREYFYSLLIGFFDPDSGVAPG